MKRRKSIVSTLVILVAALVGLALMNIGQGAAEDESALSALKASTAEANATADSPSAFNSDALPALGKMAGALVIVIVCIYVAVFLLKRFAGGKYRGQGKGNLLEIIESTYVAPKKTISLVRVADKAVLLGITEGNLSVLTELDADQTAIALSGEAHSETGQIEEDQFDRLFQRAAGQLRRFAPKKSDPIEFN